ncbi:MAG: hypothetical protein GC181_01585 [Bacteroidetes bacterium]|nr:hypothetical protein [Bacteroidota bacterium]
MKIGVRHISVLIALIMLSVQGIAKPDLIKVSGQDYDEYVTDRVEYKLVDEQWEAGGVYSDSGWHRTDKRALNFGMTDQGCWIRLRVESEEESLLELESSMIEKCELYKRVGAKCVLISEKNLGFISDDKYSDVYPVFDIVKETDNIYLYVESEIGLSIPLEILSIKQYRLNFTKRNVIFGFILGLFGVIFFYNFSLFIFLRVRMYLFYCTYVLGIFLTQSILTSLGFRYIEILTGSLTRFAIFFVTTIMLSSAGLFLKWYFKAELEEDKTSRYLLLSFVFMSFSFPLLPIVLPEYIAFAILNFILTFGSLVCLFVAYKFVINGSTNAVFIAIAWTLLLISSIIYILSTFGIFEHSFITKYSILIGASIETVLISLVLGNRIKTILHDKQVVENEVKEKEKQVKAMESEVAKTKLKALQSQMNPHFIFNALDSIHTSLLKRDPDRAGEIIRRFAKLVRLSLEHSRLDEIPLSSEVVFETQYFEMEKLKGAVEFTYEILIDPELENLNPLIPPHMVQPICENAIKHAFNDMENQVNHIVLSFDANWEKDLVVVSVSDNGSGFKRVVLPESHRSFGLSIMSERFDVLTLQGQSSSVEINRELMPNPNHGTYVVIYLPML